MNNIFEPLHRSYRMTLIMILMLGLSLGGNYYLLEKYLTTKAQRDQCYEAANLQAGELTQCRTDAANSAAENELLKQEVQQRIQELATAMDTIAGLQAKIETLLQRIASLEEHIASLSQLNYENTLIIEQLNDDLASARDELASTIRQLKSLEQQFAIQRAELYTMVAAQDLLAFLRQNMPFLSLFLVASASVPVIFATGWRPPRKDKAKTSPADHVWVHMTREEARKYARGSRHKT